MKYIEMELKLYKINQKILLEGYLILLIIDVLDF